MVDDQKTTDVTLTQPDDSRYPRRGGVYAIRWVFIRWLLIPLTCAIFYILFAAFNLYQLSSHGGFQASYIFEALLLPTFLRYWWIVVPLLVVLTILIFLAYRWADSDETNEYQELRRQREQWEQPGQREREREQREREQQPPPPGFMLRHTLAGHTNSINSVAWSPDGRLLASGSDDHTIRLWDSSTGRQIRMLEGHTGTIISLSFSAGGRLLASKSWDGTVRLWNTDVWETVAILNETSSGYLASLSFHPKSPILATLGELETVIRIWDLDVATILSTPSAIPSVHYTNAKVVLVGDSGVGKSGLGLVLTDQPFAATESTHGRRVWTFESKEVEFGGGRKETRETLLWDLAGQPGYRLIQRARRRFLVLRVLC